MSEIGEPVMLNVVSVTTLSFTMPLSKIFCNEPSVLMVFG